MRRKSGSMTFLATRQDSPPHLGTRHSCTQIVLSSFSSSRLPVGTRCHIHFCKAERYVIRRYSKKQCTCLRCKPHSPASALPVVKVMFSFLCCLPLALFPNSFKTWVEGKVLVIEPPQIPNSGQSPPILPLLPPNVTVSPIESTLGIACVFLLISPSVTNAWF